MNADVMPDCIDPDGHCGQCAREGEPECCICGHDFPSRPAPEQWSRRILFGCVLLTLGVCAVVFFLHYSTTSLFTNIQLPTK